MTALEEYIRGVANINPLVHLDDKRVICGMCKMWSLDGSHDPNCLWLWAKRLVERLDSQ